MPKGSNLFSSICPPAFHDLSALDYDEISLVPAGMNKKWFIMRKGKRMLNIAQITADGLIRKGADLDTLLKGKDEDASQALGAIAKIAQAVDGELSPEDIAKALEIAGVDLEKMGYGKKHGKDKGKMEYDDEEYMYDKDGNKKGAKKKVKKGDEGSGDDGDDKDKDKKPPKDESDAKVDKIRKEYDEKMEKMQKSLDAEVDERLRRDYVQKAAEFDIDGTSQEDLGTLFHNLSKSADKADLKKVEQIFKGMAAQNKDSKIFGELGRVAKNGEDSGDAAQVIASATDTIAKANPEMSAEQARIAAYKSNPEEYAQLRAMQNDDTLAASKRQRR